MNPNLNIFDALVCLINVLANNPPVQDSTVATEIFFLINLFKVFLKSDIYKIKS